MSNCHPTKEQLEDDYFGLNLSHQQIAEKYGFKTRQVIHRLFKKFDIKSKSKKEVSAMKFAQRVTKPSREELEKLYQSNSILKMSKILKISRDVLSRWIDEYGIEKTYFKNNIDNKVLEKELYAYSIKELCIKYNVEPNEIKRRVKNIPQKTYALDELKKIFSLYDINSKYFARQICNDDNNVYQSIVDLTENHFLQSDKITERIYRLLNNYKSTQKDICRTTKEPLKFYTMSKGYGNSNLKVSKSGFIWTENFCLGYSKISQDLFWKIYKILPKKYKSKVKFSELNYEVKIKVNKMDYDSGLCDNRYSYIADFIMENKNIEFDGEYWHGFENIKIKDKKRDNYLTNLGYKILRIKESDYKKDPEKVIKKCIKFLVK